MPKENPTKHEDTQVAKERLNQVSEDTILQDLLSNLPSVDEITLELPSKNKFYALLDAAKPITIRPMTFEDEKAMMSNKNANTDVLNILLTRCVSNINIQDILEMDKLYIIMKLREISYGDEYKASFNCPACRSDNNVTFNLSQLNINYAEDDFANPIEVELPILKKKVKVRLPRVSDEGYFKNTEIAAANLWRFVEDIEGYTSMNIIAKVIKQLPLKDAHAVLEAIGGEGLGIDTKVRFVCNFCSHNEIMDLPITQDFFSVN